MSNYKKQHYVPKTYLKHFAFDNKTNKVYFLNKDAFQEGAVISIERYDEANMYLKKENEVSK